MWYIISGNDTNKLLTESRLFWLIITINNWKYSINANYNFFIIIQRNIPTTQWVKVDSRQVLSNYCDCWYFSSPIKVQSLKSRTHYVLFKNHVYWVSCSGAVVRQKVNQPTKVWRNIPKYRKNKVLLFRYLRVNNSFIVVKLWQF